MGEIKKQEKGNRDKSRCLKEWQRECPALMKAYEYQKKAAKAGFDWANAEGAWEKV